MIDETGNPRNKRSIFLIGSRGAGKTTIGRLVASKLGLPFWDADILLEEREAQSIREIFASEGEPGFRKREEAILAELCAGATSVIATGGGAVLSENNRRRMRQAGWVVWLSADPATLWQRMQSDPITAIRRPNLTVGGQEEVKELLKGRESFYRDCAHLEVKTAGRSLETIASEIVAQY
jgi:shikimate kinase